MEDQKLAKDDIDDVKKKTIGGRAEINRLCNAMDNFTKSINSYMDYLKDNPSENAADQVKTSKTNGSPIRPNENEIEKTPENSIVSELSDCIENDLKDMHLSEIDSVKINHQEIPNRSDDQQNVQNYYVAEDGRSSKSNRTEILMGHSKNLNENDNSTEVVLINHEISDLNSNNQILVKNDDSIKTPENFKYHEIVNQNLIETNVVEKTIICEMCYQDNIIKIAGDSILCKICYHINTINTIDTWIICEMCCNIVHVKSAKSLVFCQKCGQIIKEPINDKDDHVVLDGEKDVNKIKQVAESMPEIDTPSSSTIVNQLALPTTEDIQQEPSTSVQKEQYSKRDQYGKLREAKYPAYYSNYIENQTDEYRPVFEIKSSCKSQIFPVYYPRPTKNTYYLSEAQPYVINNRDLTSTIVQYNDYFGENGQLMYRQQIYQPINSGNFTYSRHNRNFSRRRQHHQQQHHRHHHHQQQPQQEPQQQQQEQEQQQQKQPQPQQKHQQEQKQRHQQRQQSQQRQQQQEEQEHRRRQPRQHQQSKQRQQHQNVQYHSTRKPRNNYKK